MKDFLPNMFKKIPRWVSIIIFPTLMLSLYKVPFDFITVGVWLIAYFVVLFSFIKIIKIVFKLLSNKFGRNSKNTTSFFELILPTLLIITFFIAKTLLNLSIESAKKFALTEALNMKEYISRKGTCNPKLQGWKHFQNYQSDKLSISYGDYGTKYLVSYQCNPESTAFSFSVRVNKDDSFNIYYDKNESMYINYGNEYNTTTLKLDENTSVNLILEEIN